MKIRLRGMIQNSYTTGAVMGDSSNTGGLVGENSSGGVIEASYWLRRTGSGLSSVGDGSQLSYNAARTERRLKSPTEAVVIYSGWSPRVWDFGTSDQFPALKRVDGSLLPNQGMILEGELREGLRRLEVVTSGGELSPTFGVSTTHYVIAVANRNIVLRLTAYNPKQR